MTNEDKMRVAIEVAKESLKSGELLRQYVAMKKKGSLVDFCNTLLSL